MNEVTHTYPETDMVPMEAPPGRSAVSLMDLAIQGVSVEVIEKMMELDERNRANVARQEFDRAMSSALSELPIVLKRADGHGYKYETLGSVVEAAREPLSRNKLSFRWRTAQDRDVVIVTCVVSHAGGHSEETTLASPLSGGPKVNAAQAIGATVTYLQRYTLKAALGLAAEKDTDGVPPQVEHEPALSAPTGPNMDRIRPHLAEVAQSHDLEQLKAAYGKARRELRGDDFEEVKRAVNAKKAKLEAASDAD